jgi:DNA-binding NarL/FixJ family response regulator
MTTLAYCACCVSISPLLAMKPWQWKVLTKPWLTYWSILHIGYTDFSMHGMDGIALCRTIHQHYPLLPVIMLTAHYSSIHAAAAQQYGVFSVLPKPFDSKNLLEQIACALNVKIPPYAYEVPDSSPPSCREK